MNTRLSTKTTRYKDTRTSFPVDQEGQITGRNSELLTSRQLVERSRHIAFFLHDLEDQLDLQVEQGAE